MVSVDITTGAQATEANHRAPRDKPLVWLLALPVSRPMPGIGSRCQELRIRDRDHHWRIVYRIDRDAIVILDVFAKMTGETPETVKEACRQRLKRYDAASRSGA